MAEKYYPDFYLRKRERDSRYRRYSSLVIGCVLVAVVGGVLGYLGYVHILQPSRQPRTAADLADEKRDLEQEQLLGSGSPGAEETPGSVDGGAEQAGDAEIGDLSNVDYSPSMAGVSVEVEGGTGQDGSAMAEAGSAEEAESGSAASDGDVAGQDTPTPPSEEPAEETSPAETGNSGVAAPEEAEAPAAAPEQERDSESEGVAEDAEDVAEDGSGGSGPVFKVYAGSFTSREGAETARAGLAPLGLQGTIVEMELEYLVHVATLDSYEDAEALQAKLVASGFASAFATLKRH